METNYYTPTIDEFYVGFEYEANRLCVDEINREWQKTIYTEKEYNYGCDYAGADSVRVKYLDKEDMRDLGFHILEEFAANILEFKTPSQMFHLFIHPNRIVHIRTAHPDYPPVVVFNGKIKNKCELKKIMRAVGCYPF